MTYHNTRTVDRRADYYSRAGSPIAKGFFDYIARFEQGRRIQASLFPKPQPAGVKLAKELA